MTKSIHPFRAILNRTLRTVDDQGYLASIGPSDTEFFCAAVESLIRRRISSPLLLYRGDSKDHLRKQLFLDRSGQNSDSLMYAKVFYFGQKARHFWMEQDRDIRRRDWLTCLHDDSPLTFARLFENIRRVLGYGFPHVHRFCEKNIELSAYFKDQANKEDFVTRATLLSPKERQNARDYYLYLLHTYGRSGIHKPTLLVSASSDLRVASRFRKIDSENVVLYIFVPTPHSKYCVSSRLKHQDLKVIRNMGGPLYSRNSGLYPEQKEYGFRGAVFPQLILGIHDQTTDQFIVNPHLLAMSDRSPETLSRSGIQIDQNDFENLIPQTGFHRFGLLDEDGLYHEL